VRRGLEEALRERPEVLLIGEDLESPYGGAFKCTPGLSEEFPGRVRNMPVSEAAILGLGSGLALAGFRPVVEIMFGDFLALAADQWINHAAKFRFMYDGRVSVPLIVRTPMGGKRGYGATHSQSLEKHFLGVPDTQVLCLHHRVSPAALYRRLFDTIDRPTLVLENKVLYGATVATDAPAGFHVSSEREALFPTVRVQPELPADLTLVAIGGMGPEAEQAALTLFREHEIAADLCLPTRLYPFDLAPLMESLSATGRLLVVEEGQGFVSLGSEIVAQVVERSHPGGIACRRVAAAPAAVPAARPLEEQCLPGVAEIVARARELVREHVH
jgi:2-oxoisovalerate dehydrogenase E1 component